MRPVLIAFRLVCVMLLASCATPTTQAPPREETLTLPPPIVSVPPIESFTTAIRTWANSWNLEESDCPNFYIDATAPVVQSDHDFGEAVEFCYTHFSVLHSPQTRGALWSATYLTPYISQRGDCFPRGRFSFRVEQGVASEYRASLRDYSGFGHLWEIGHMTPANDMPSPETQRETFVFSNAIPQAAGFNGDEWAELENRVHNLAQDLPEGLYVVTGPIFAADVIQRLNGRVGIPTHVFKAVYDPANERAIVFVAENIDDPQIEQVSLTRLEDYGITAFPTLANEVRSGDEQWELPARENRECRLQ